MTGDAPRLLLALPQLAQDPGSGAARSMTAISEVLAARGWQVRALTTTVCEAAGVGSAQAFLAGQGIDVARRTGSAVELHYRHRGVAFVALVVDRTLRVATWERVSGRSYSRAFTHELNAFRPHVVFTYGMLAGDLRRQRDARRAGAAVVFGLRNEAYLGCQTWDHVSGVLTPSQYLSDRYAADAGLISTALPVPLDSVEVVAPHHDPIFMTMVNPTIAKGVDFFAHLAERLSVRRPDLPFLVVESQGRAGTLVAAGLRAGFDLRRHGNIMTSGAVPLPRDVFAPTRVLLVPSQREAGARVVAESLLNGVPPIVSDRGGLPEMCRGAGYVLPVDDANDVDAWIDVVAPLMDDEGHYVAASARAAAAGRAYDRAILADAYDGYFRRLIGCDRTEPSNTTS